MIISQRETKICKNNNNNNKRRRRRRNKIGFVWECLGFKHLGSVRALNWGIVGRGGIEILELKVERAGAP